MLPHNLSVRCIPRCGRSLTLVSEFKPRPVLRVVAVEVDERLMSGAQQGAGKQPPLLKKALFAREFNEPLYVVSQSTALISPLLGTQQWYKRATATEEFSNELR